MKIKYEFVNGDVVEIEVDQEIGNVVLELEKKEKCQEDTVSLTLKTIKADGRLIIILKKMKRHL